MEQQNLEFSTFLLTALIREVSSNVSTLFSQLVDGGIVSTTNLDIAVEAKPVSAEEKKA